MKAQITLFMVVGMVVMAVFLLLMFLVGNVTNQSLREQHQGTVSSAIKTGAIQYYASTCVRDALKSGIELLGLQGGNIFSWQYGGSERNPDYLNPLNVTYVISKNVFASSPAYPCTVDRNPPAYCRYPYADVVFGSSKNLQRLEGSISIKKQLEKYISAYVKDCMKIKDSELSGYNITTGLPRTAVIFSSIDVKAKVDYPVSVMVGRNEPAKQFINFEAQVPVRFKRIYEAVQEVAKKEVGDISYDITTALLPGTRLSNLGVLFSRITFGHEDLFIINDTLSKIDGKNFVFRFSRQNRPPALEYINRSASREDTYDYLVIISENITFTAKAADPDEHDVIYSSEGDLGTYGATTNFNTTRLINRAGYYRQTVKATDGDEADWQNVRILVDNKLKANFTIKSIYADIPDGIVSTEDPFILDANATNKTLDPFARYILEWPTLMGGYSGANNLCSIYPGFGGCSGQLPGINTIQWTYTGGGVDLYAYLKYSGGVVQFDNEIQPVTVLPCLPHRNNTPSYPYNGNVNPFYANHTCCLGDVNNAFIADTNTICYNGRRCVTDGYRLSGIRRYCDGVRGNTCTGNTETVTTPLCGIKGKSGCSDDIAAECSGKGPWKVANGIGCYGTHGCENVCRTTAVLNDGGKIDHCGCNSPINLLITEIGRDNGKPCVNIATNSGGSCSSGSCI